MTTTGPSTSHTVTRRDKRGKFVSDYVWRCCEICVQIYLKQVEELRTKNDKLRAMEDHREDEHDKESEVSEKLGHILVFLTGQEEINQACQLVSDMIEQADNEDVEGEKGAQNNNWMVLDPIILPLYSSLPQNEQLKIFKKYRDESHDDHENTKRRRRRGRSSSNSPSSSYIKIIFSTNIAETSVTIPHVRFVVDCGFVKQKMYNPNKKMESLLVVPISQV